MGWSKSFLLRPLIPKICSCQQVSLTRQPRDVSRVNELETAEETAFDILLTLKSKAKKVFSKKDISGLAKSRALEKYLETFHQTKSKASGAQLWSLQVICSLFLSKAIIFQALLTQPDSCSCYAQVLALTTRQAFGGSSGRRQECKGCSFSPSPQGPWPALCMLQWHLEQCQGAPGTPDAASQHSPRWGPTRLAKSCPWEANTMRYSSSDRQTETQDR